MHYHIGGQGGLGGGGGNANPTRTGQWTPQRAVEDMDRAGTAAGSFCVCCGRWYGEAYKTAIGKRANSMKQGRNCVRTTQIALASGRGCR